MLGGGCENASASLTIGLSKNLKKELRGEGAGTTIFDATLALGRPSSERRRSSGANSSSNASIVLRNRRRERFTSLTGSVDRPLAASLPRTGEESRVATIGKRVVGRAGLAEAVEGEAEPKKWSYSARFLRLDLGAGATPSALISIACATLGKYSTASANLTRRLDALEMPIALWSRRSNSGEPMSVAVEASLTVGETGDIGISPQLVSMSWAADSSKAVLGSKASQTLVQERTE